MTTPPGFNATRNLTAPVTAEQVDAVRFTPVRLREGYDMGEVDAFLDRIIATLRAETSTPLTAEDVDKALFTPRRLREGYDMGEVDHFLDLVIETLQVNTAATPDDETPSPSEAGDIAAPVDGRFTTCGICFVPVRVVDEDGHRGWHVSLLGQR